jgi:hypothetical protein
MVGKAGEAAQSEAESVDCKVREDAVRACDSLRVSRKARILTKNGAPDSEDPLDGCEPYGIRQRDQAHTVTDAYGVSPAHDIKRTTRACHRANIFWLMEFFPTGFFSLIK